jgi:arylsulfatase A-like enzyme
MKPAAVLLMVAALASLAPRHTVAAADAAKPARPNIVVIMSDDMGYSDAGCFGGEIDTPNIDFLALQGLRFTQFYNTSRCCPTRAALLTGVYPHQAGVGHMTWKKLDLPGYRSDLSPHTPTLAELLKPAGYGTYMTGKWHVTWNDLPDKPRENWPRQRGFDRFYGMIAGSGSYYDPRMLVRDDTPTSPWGDAEYKPERYYFTDAIADQSARYIREHDEAQEDKPLFLYVGFTAPHWPLHAPEETIAKYKGKYDEGYEEVRSARFERMRKMGLIHPSWALSPAPAKWDDQPDKAWEARCMEVYAAQIDRMDQGIGKIVDALRQTGRLENTLILFLHDNGGCAEPNGRKPGRPNRDANPAPHKPTDPQWMSRPRVTRDGRPVRSGPKVMPGPDDTFIAYGENWANVSNTPFREYKHYVHEGGISTPLIAYWPAGIKRARGEFERVPGHVIDIAATVADLAGVKLPEQLNGKATTPFQGESFARVFKGWRGERQRPIFFEHEGNRAVRDGKWKLVAKGVNGPWELYDVEADRTEMHDLASREPERVKQMAGAWQHWAEASHVLPLRPWDDAAGAAAAAAAAGTE